MIMLIREKKKKLGSCTIVYWVHDVPVAMLQIKANWSWSIKSMEDTIIPHVIIAMIECTPVTQTSHSTIYTVLWWP